MTHRHAPRPPKAKEVRTRSQQTTVEDRNGEFTPGPSHRTRVKSLLSANPPPPDYSSDLHKPGSSALQINVPFEATRTYPQNLQHW
jgi:hypothetical protein